MPTRLKTKIMFFRLTAIKFKDAPQPWEIDFPSFSVFEVSPHSGKKLKSYDVSKPPQQEALKNDNLVSDKFGVYSWFFRCLSTVRIYLKIIIFQNAHCKMDSKSITLNPDLFFECWSLTESRCQKSADLIFSRALQHGRFGKFSFKSKQRKNASVN